MSHDLNFSKTFNDTDTISVNHNLDSAQVLARVVINGHAEIQEVDTMTVIDRNNIVITLVAPASGVVVVQLPQDWRASE
jgi:hypothetical protein